MPHIYAPWNKEQVENLNRFQQAGRMHPFTCGDCGAVLKATLLGWVCKGQMGECRHSQDWAHDFMAMSEVVA